MFMHRDRIPNRDAEQRHQYANKCLQIYTDTSIDWNGHGYVYALAEKSSNISLRFYETHCRATYHVTYGDDEYSKFQ